MMMYVFRIAFLFSISVFQVLQAQYIQNYAQALLLSNAVVNEIQEQIIDIEGKLPDENPLTSDGSVDNPAAESTQRPVSFLSGRVSDRLIHRMADYLYSLLQGTGEVIKPTRRPTTTTTTPTTTPSTTIFTTPLAPSTPPSPSLPTDAPFNDENMLDAAIIRQELNILDQNYRLNNIRRKPVFNQLLRKMGVSRKKSEKLWKKSRRRRVSGRV